MLKFLKLKSHKGIKNIQLCGLQQFNVVCGKNNSGKSSIMEAVADSSKRSFGLELNEELFSLLKTNFQHQSQRYSSPNPGTSESWFATQIEARRGTIIFEDEVGQIDSQLRTQWHKGSRHGSDTFNFSNVFAPLFNRFSDFKPILVPPKRDLQMKYSVSNIVATGQPAGIDILNKLFILQNQNTGSPERQRYEQINEAFKNISGGFCFHVGINEKHDMVLKFCDKENLWLDGEMCGLGLRDVLYVLHYILDPSYSAILIEEPESHIHPDMQRRLLKFISENKEKQFFFTTHSNVFLDPAYTNKIFYVENKNGEVVVFDETSKANLLLNLGYSVVDNLVSDMIVLTEGPTDIPVLRQICDKLGFLHKFSIKFCPMGGDNMHLIDLSVFAERSKVMALVDLDPKSNHIREKFQEETRKLGVRCVKLKKYALENYFSIRAIREIYPHQTIPEGLKELKSDEPAEKQLGFSVKAKGCEIVKNMTLNDFEGTDLLDFCREMEKTLMEAKA